MDDTEEYILRWLGVYKIKFETLGSILPKKIDAYHLYLNDILKFKDDDEDVIISTYPNTVVAAIINIAAHFRHFFASSGQDVKIYFYVNEREGHIRKYKKILDKIEIILKYVKGIYLIRYNLNFKIKPSVETMVVIKHIAKNHKHNVIQIKGKTAYQLIDKHNTLLRFSRKDTYCVTEKNWINHLLDNMGEHDYDLSTEHIPSVLAITAIKGYGFNRVIRILNKAVLNNEIQDEYYPSIEVLLAELGITDKKKVKEVVDKFNNINLRYYYNKLSKSSIITLDNYIIDKYAVDELRKLNSTYFTGLSSLQVEELLMEPDLDHPTAVVNVKW